MQELLRDRVVDRQQLDRTDPEGVQVPDGGIRGQPGVGAAQILANASMSRGETLDVKFVDRRLVPRRVEQAVALPVEVRIDDDALRDRGGIVLVVGDRAVLVARLVAEDAGALPVDPFLDRARIGVDQQLRRVEAVTLLGGIATVDAVAVALPGPDAGEVRVPVRARARREFMPDLGPVRSEEAELDPLGVLGEQRKVRPLAVRSRAQRERAPGMGAQAGPPPESQITASGGSVSSTDHGWLFHSRSSATSAPFPTPEPP